MKKPLFASLAAALFLMQASCGGCDFNRVGTGIKNIRIEPSQDVLVGEEVFFDASRVPGADDPYTCSYEWDFGDDSMPACVGRSVVHTYMRPGTYTVTLIISGNDRRSGTVDITVSGDYIKLPPRPDTPPLIHYAFENNPDDSSENGLNATWSGEGGFCPGAENTGTFLTGSSYIHAADPAHIIGGSAGLTVSLWFRKSNPGGDGFLISYPGLFYIQLRDGGMWLNGQLTTVNGSATAEPWYMGAEDTNWHHCAMVYDGSSVHIWFDRREQIMLDNEGTITGCPRPITGNLPADAGDHLYIGTRSGTAPFFEGDIDEVKIYDRALTADELNTGFELRRADYHARTAQYLFLQIPGAITAEATNRLNVTLSGDNAYTAVLADRTGLQPEERVLLRNADLPAGNYTLTASVYDASDGVLDSITERFSKPYDGAPEVGMDENNAMRVQGELFFPVTPFGLRNFEIAEWAAEKYINVLHSQGFWGMAGPPVYTADGWEEYLDTGAAIGFRAFGPGGGWAFYGSDYSNYLDRNADISKIEEYVNRLKNHEGMLAWNWRDEPELGGDEQYLPAGVVRAWSRRCHDLDPNHPSSVNLVGAWIGDAYPSWAWSRSGDYLYMDNAGIFGRRTNVAEILSMDYYPIEWAAPHSRGATVAQLITILDAFRERTGNMLPLMSCVETCDINEADGGVRQPTPWHPTPAQLRMLTWINVIHGMKGIVWFPWHSGTPDGNYPVMAEFVDQITRLTPVVLGPEINPVVTISAPGARIDTMVREYNGHTYLFAVNVNESDITGASIGSTVNATINISGLTYTGNASVFDEGRTVTVTGGSLIDGFAVNAVHIYVLPE
jgi:PKD repeat protein